MQKVTRLGKRRGAWLAIPLALAVGSATALLWPQSASTSVLVANHDLAAGTVATAADFDTASVRIGDSTSLYLQKLPAGGVLVHRIAQGELLTRTNLAPSPLQTMLATVIQFKDALPVELRVGSALDVWSTEDAEGAEPTPIALECEIANLRSESSLGQKATSVEVKCLPEFLPKLLKAKATGAVIALVLQPTTLEQ
ncbi:MAG: SAF domain-containing protein [Rhodoluna sp.]|nr:SAF domain-containing protein [Rhodoluna sp.]